MVSIYTHQTDYLFLFLRNKHRQIGDASYQYCIQQMNLLKRLIDEMADNGIDGNREAYNDSNLLIVFYVQIMPDDFVMQLHRF